MSARPADEPIPLLELLAVSRRYAEGASAVCALDDVSLRIYPGEFVAIMGQSGSGKSTLMNILGCLDRPSQGRYLVAGRDVSGLNQDELAALRRDTFGFVFQRYHLLNSVSASENVELPAIYAGFARRVRAQRAQALLTRLGLGDRAGHRPNQLSGGQQQRVSIARALMNDPEVILADEPTGALDSRSGGEVLDLFKQLHARGHTVVLITHDAKVAAHAQRVIHIGDGRILDDSGSAPPCPDSAARVTPERQDKAAPPDSAARSWLPDLGEAIKMALRSLRANGFRSALTLLGVVIGVAAVVAMLAIGNGSKQRIMDRIGALGRDVLTVYPGAPGLRSGAGLSAADTGALKGIAHVAAISPERSLHGATLRHGAFDIQATVTGAWPAYATKQAWTMARGGFITEDDVRGYAPVIVLGKSVADSLFRDGGDPLGRYVLVKNVPFEVIGVLAAKGANTTGMDMDKIAVTPLSTAQVRLFGKRDVDFIAVVVDDIGHIDASRRAIDKQLRELRGRQDFMVRSNLSTIETVAETQDTLTMLLGSVAAISLLVGGIGVMNIMLVTVTERTREIGMRMATGARANDILLQFNTEALVVCGIGGLIGVALGTAAGLLAQANGVRVMFTAAPALLAFLSAVATGLLFGYLPARKASRLDPVAALAAE